MTTLEDSEHKSQDYEINSDIFAWHFVSASNAWRFVSASNAWRAVDDKQDKEPVFLLVACFLST